MKPELPDPHTAPELFDNVLLRRVLAYGIDLTILIAITMGVLLLGLISGFFSLGLGWVATPVALVVALVAYYAATLGSHKRATVGMATMDLVLTHTRGAPLNGLAAFLHPLLFWLTFWISWPVSVVLPLLTPRQQMLHDLVLGTLMVRRSPMESHWRANGSAATQA